MHTLQVVSRKVNACKRRPVQLGIAEDGFFEVGISQVCASQVCIGQVSSSEGGTFQVPAAEVAPWVCRNTSRSNCIARGV